MHNSSSRHILPQENRNPWLGSQVPVGAPRPVGPGAIPDPDPALGVAPGGAAADPNRIPISGDHTPGAGAAGGGTAARTGCGAVSGAAVSEGRGACTGGSGWEGGWEGGGAAYVE